MLLNLHRYNPLHFASQNGEVPKSLTLLGFVPIPTTKGCVTTGEVYHAIGIGFAEYFCGYVLVGL